MAEVTQSVAHTVAHSIPEQEPTALGFGPAAWVAIAMLLVFALAFWKKVPGAIGKALDGKIAEIREQLAEAEALRKDAEALKVEYEAKAKAATSDAEAILERAHHEAQTIVTKAKDDATNLIARRQKMAEDKIASEERAAIAELRGTTAKAAAAAATKLIAERHDANADKGLVDSAIAALGR